uniref:Uncharacterized protein n=1 Tax=Oryza sativa subsp. japonica TaxID=39947 RepID=Q6YUB9_ORYSJ|nr:hypothetical protein [Oryza sativa Japonica Group]BAD10681.1 hypothetical protein [Oryza sativa Japonica Group]
MAASHVWVCAVRSRAPSLSPSLSANRRHRDDIAGAVEVVVAERRRRRRQIRCCRTPPSSRRRQIREVVIAPSPAVVGAVVNRRLRGRRCQTPCHRRHRQPLSVLSPDPSPAEVIVACRRHRHAPADSAGAACSRGRCRLAPAVVFAAHTDWPPRVHASLPRAAAADGDETMAAAPTTS